MINIVPPTLKCITYKLKYCLCWIESVNSECISSHQSTQFIDSYERHFKGADKSIRKKECSVRALEETGKVKHFLLRASDHDLLPLKVFG